MLEHGEKDDLTGLYLFFYVAMCNVVWHKQYANRGEDIGYFFWLEKTPMSIVPEWF